MSNHTNRRAKQEYQPSLLLSNSENHLLFDIVGSRSATLASAVVQVYIAPAPNYCSWTKKCCGVACFIKDNGKRSYFIRVYNLSTRGMIWEQELYNQFKYRVPRPFFHIFDGQDSPVGLNFANDEEANRFQAAVTDKLRQRENRKAGGALKRQSSCPPPRPTSRPNVKRLMSFQERKKSQHGTHGSPNNVMARSAPEASTPSLPSGGINKGDTLGRKSKDKNKKGKKPRLTKEDIGTPTDFRHVGHVGWDPDRGFDMNNLDPSLKKLFDTVGISENQLQDKETAKFIYDFIDQHGGIEAVKREQSFPPLFPSHTPPPPPSRHVMPPTIPSGPPPPPPSRSPAGPPPPPPPNRLNRSMGAPPPPPPSRSEPPAPPSRTILPPPPPAFSSHAPPPPPPMGGPPAPPGPPPPPPPGPPPPPVPGLPPPPPAETGGRGALLDQIKAGKQLSHVDSQPAAPPAPVDSRSQLLDQIRGGKVLKKVEPQEERPKSEDAGGSMAAALAMALANRADKIQGDSDSEAEEEDDDSDWED